MAPERDLGYQAGLLSFIRPGTSLRLLPNLRTVPLHRMPRSLGVTVAGLAGTPLSLWERLRHGATIEQAELTEPPVFIIGHWRSGTTHLHNLMSRDPQFGCLRMFQALAPDCSVATKSWLPDLFSRCFPSKRPMDNLEWPMDAPQEEEIPLTKVTPYSWYLQFLFPQEAMKMFKLGVLFEGGGPQIRREVKRKYLRLLKTATVHAGGRRLLLKNPVNTARIPFLLDLFPDAKFVVIHRSPYDVFPSSMNLHRKILNLTSLQDYDDRLIEKNVVEIYEQVMGRYLNDRDLVPEGNLVEVAFADLEAQPMETIASIYDRLDLAGFADAAEPIADYSASQANYKKNSFVLSDREVELVTERWQFAFDAFGYQPKSVAGSLAAAV